jgi:hypothetical protein
MLDDPVHMSNWRFPTPQKPMLLRHFPLLPNGVLVSTHNTGRELSVTIYLREKRLRLAFSEPCAGALDRA